MGGIMGCTGGLIVGAATAKSSGGGLVNAPGLDQAIAGAIGGVVGGLGGMAIGAVIGGTMKENGQTYVTPDRRDFVLLRGVARYKTEPEFLKAITSK